MTDNLKHYSMNPKELSLCHKLWFFNPNIFATQSQTQEIFQTMISVRSNSLSLKYQRFTPSGLKDMELEILSMRQWLNSFVYLIVSLIFGLSRVDIDETFWNIRRHFEISGNILNPSSQHFTYSLHSVELGCYPSPPPALDTSRAYIGRMTVL